MNRRIKVMLAGFGRFLNGLHLSKVVFLGYLSCILAGWLRLCLSFVQRGEEVRALDNLFIAPSGVPTTGVVTV